MITAPMAERKFSDKPEMDQPRRNANDPPTPFAITSQGGLILSLIGGAEYTMPRRKIDKPIKKERTLTYTNKTIEQRQNTINDATNISLGEI